MQHRGGMGMRYQEKRRRKLRIRPRFFIFMFFVIAVLAGLIFGITALVGLIAGEKESVVALGLLEDPSEFRALILRDEESISVEPYDTVQYIASENQNVKEGDQILEIYRKGNMSELMAELEAIRASIRQKQEEGLLAGIINEDLIELDDRIYKKSEQVRASISLGDNSANIAELERELAQMMAARQNYLKSSQTTLQDTSLQELYTKLADTESRINSYREPYSASRDGRVSYSLDGMEYFLNMNTLANIDYADAESMHKGSLPEPLPPEERAKPYMYRVVAPDKWYTLLMAKAKDRSFTTGSSVDIIFAGYEDMPFTAKVENVKPDGDQVLVTLSMSEDIGPLINARAVTAKLGGRIEGMVVPLTAIKESNGMRGVFLTSGKFVEVEVRGQDDENALVMPVVEGELEPRMRVVSK